MKLRTRQTILVGLAFLSISAFWQLYDAVIPLILRDTFHVGDTLSGGIMALDNVLAVFLLPLFGKLSDKTHTRIGRRMPYILCGTAVAVVVMNLMPSAVKAVSLPVFMGLLGLLLLSMSLYRSPAVALMPDVTPKPLRSKGNAIINLMGAVGGVFTLIANKFLVRTLEGGGEDYSLLFVAVSVLMAVAVAVLLLTVKENKLAAEAAEINDKLDCQEEEQEPAANAKGLKSLNKDMRRSLFLILISVSLWFMGYNAVTSAFTKYVSVMWGSGLGNASTMLLVATVGAVCSYVPVGLFSSKFGRKKVIQAGVILLAVSFAAAGFYRTYHWSVYLVFILVGLAWAMINVNSFPMVVEISKSGDVGTFTGYYYTFSMAAQIVTPILSGWLLEHVGYWTLMPYAALMAAGALVTISLTRHGDSIPDAPESKLEAFAGGDD